MSAAVSSSERGAAPRLLRTLHLVRAARSEAGQATVELFAFVPLVVVMALIALSLLVAHAAGEQAGEAAEAAGIAVLQERDPRAAAKAALPAGARARSTVTIRDGRVRVHVRPRLPLALGGIEERLAGEAEVSIRDGRS